MNQSVKVKVKASVVRGGEIVQTEEANNLLLDNFFTVVRNFGNTGYLNVATSAVAGTDASANFRDSGAVTFAVDNLSPLGVTSSANFFVPSDVGTILKLDSGEQLRVTAYVSPTRVTCATFSGTIVGGVAGTIWRVHQTTLGALVQSSPSFSQFVETSFVDVSAATRRSEFTQTVDFPATVTPASIFELGWRNTSLPSPQIFGRVVLTSPLNLFAGDQIRLTLTFILTIDTTPKVVGSGAFSGTSRFYGAASLVGVAPAASTNNIGFYNVPIDQSTIKLSALVAQSFVSGALAWTHLGEGVFRCSGASSVSQNNGTWTGIGLTGVFVHKFDVPVTKTNLQVATWEFLMTLTRDMPNT